MQGGSVSNRVCALPASRRFGTCLGRRLGLVVLPLAFCGALLSAALFAAPATAATCNWVNTAGGDWDASANWRCDGLPAVPGIADDVYILADGTYTVTLNADASVASLMLGGSTGLQTLLVLNHRLFVDGACTVFDTGLLDLAGTGSLAFDGGGTVTFSALRVAAGGGIDYGAQDMTVKTLTLDQFSTISGSGTITVTEQMHWQWGGTLTGTGTIVIADTASALVDGGIANCTLDYYNLTNNGSLVWHGCDLVVNNKSTFLNNGTFTIHQDGGYNLTQTTGDASLINGTTGVVVKDGLAAVSVDQSFHNQGALTVQAGSLTMNGPFGNYDGAVDVQGGTLTIKGGGASSAAGPMAVSGATAKLVFNTTGFTVDGNLSGTNVSFEPIAGAVVDVNGDFNMSGTVEKYSAGTVNFNGTVTGAGDTVVVHGGQLDFKALEVSIPHLTANGGYLLGSGTVTVTDSLVSNGHFVTGVAGSGFAVVVAAGAIASIENTLTLADATLRNEGTLTWKANINDYAGGNIVNNGVFNATTDATITAYGGGGTFSNAGTFRKSAGAGASTILCPFTNAGTIAIESGTLAFWQGTSATTLQNLSTGVIRGTGTLEVSKTPANFTTAGAVTPATAGTAGILTIRGRLAQTATSSLNIDIGGTTAGTEHDKLAVVFTGTVGTGVMTLGGALNVSLINGYDPPIGASFTIVTYSSKSGTAFGLVNVPTLGAGKAFKVTYNATNIVLSVVSTDPNVSVAPASPFSYGSVDIGFPVAQTFTISNTGATGIANALAISGISLSGNADFSLNLAGGGNPCGTPPKNVAAGGNCTVAVTLTPSSVGARSATLTVASNDPDTPFASTTLNGTGYLPTYVLSVTRTGAGTGTVTSDVGSINCGATCSGSFDSGTVVTLSAAATTGSQFIGWSGAGCSGSGNCAVTMSGARSVSALFALPELFDQQTFSATSTPAGWTVVDGAGTAKVWVFNNPAGRPNLTGGSGGFAIADSYWAGNFNMNTELRSPAYDMSNQTTLMLEFKTDFSYYALGGLAEKADVDVSVNGGSTWTNVWRKTADYRGPKTETVDLTAIAAGHADVVVRFHYYDARYEYWWQVDDYKLYPIINRLTVSKGGTGAGSVSSNLGGISCGETCSAVYGIGDGVTLSATPDPGYLFRGWSGGGCSGTGDCTVTMNGPLTVTATFMDPGVFLDETFASGQPSGWSVVDTAGTGAVWRFDDPGGRTNLTGGAGGFAIADSYKAGNVNMDTSLVSPLIDLSGISGARLEFRTDFFYYTGGGTEKADVDVSVNGGTNWTNVWQKTANYRGPASESVDIAALAAGAANVRVRFHYYGARYDNWWQVDDVRLVVEATLPTPTSTPTDAPTATNTPAGTAVRTPLPTPACPSGVRQGVTVNGVAQSIDGGTWDLSGNQMTVALWAKIGAFSPEQHPTLLSKWDNRDAGNAVFVLNAGSGLGQARMLIFANDGTLVSCNTDGAVKAVANQWHHVAATLDGTTLKCYVDGVQAGSTGTWPAGRTIRTSGHHIRIGGRDDAKFLNGTVDDVRIYSRGLSAAEIASIYNGCNGSCDSYVPDLVAMWKLDEGTGTSTADSSGNGHTAALVNGATWSDAFVCCGAGPTVTPTNPPTNTSTVSPTPTITPTPNPLGTCPAGTSRHGLTTSAQLSLASSVDGGTWNPNPGGSRLTVALWANVTSLTPERYPTLLSKWDDTDPSNAVFVLNTGSGLGQTRMLVFANDGTLVHCRTDGVLNLVANQWHHVAATLDGTTLQCYVDGVQVGSTGNWPAGKTIRQSTHHIRIGGRDDAKYLTGIVDDVRIYSRGLSAAEISALYNGYRGECGNTAGNLEAWWKLDELSGSTAADSSGNGHTGTLVNGPIWSEGLACCP